MINAQGAFPLISWARHAPGGVGGWFCWRHEGLFQDRLHEFWVELKMLTLTDCPGKVAT